MARGRLGTASRQLRSWPDNDLLEKRAVTVRRERATKRGTTTSWIQRVFPMSAAAFFLAWTSCHVPMSARRWCR